MYLRNRNRTCAWCLIYAPPRMCDLLIFGLPKPKRAIWAVHASFAFPQILMTTRSATRDNGGITLVDVSSNTRTTTSTAYTAAPVGPTRSAACPPTCRCPTIYIAVSIRRPAEASGKPQFSLLRDCSFSDLATLF